MTSQRKMKLLHMAGAAWFLAAATYLLVLALRQAGVRWWVIFSLSAHTAVIAFMLISLYLFVMWQGSTRRVNFTIEHPLTTSRPYNVFYHCAPFLGTLSGLLAMLGVQDRWQFMTGLATATFISTFVVWVAVDPAVGLLETATPQSRRSRYERHAMARLKRAADELVRHRLLQTIEQEDRLIRTSWQDRLQVQAPALAAVLSHRLEPANIRRIIDFGVEAHRFGDLMYMRELSRAASTLHMSRPDNPGAADMISMCWDGIGHWRDQSLVS